MSESCLDKQKFHSLFERMIDSITNPQAFVREEFIKTLTDLCHLFDISRGVTEFYTGPVEEQTGDGEILEDYNDGREGKVFYTKRMATTQFTVIKNTLYRPEDSFKLTDEDMRKLDLVVRSLMSFVSRNRLTTQVERLAFFDQQGYPNLNSFNRKLVVLSQQNQLKGKAAVMFNLRNFSLVNSDLGKDLGDKILKLYYSAIKDAVGEDSLTCRLGGDNFMAMFDAGYLADVIGILNGYPVVYDEEKQKRIMISAYAGVFVIPENFVYHRPVEIIGYLFNALKEAKTEMFGSIVNVEEEESPDKEKVKRIRSQFSDSLEAGEFHAYYQPKVNIETGKVIGAEALCRWIHEGSVIPPLDFIPVLEQNSEICRLDFCMIETVCRDIKRWRDMGLEPVRVSVNLSRRHLSNLDLVSWLVTLVDEYSVPHECIEFELTESTTSLGIGNLKKIVGELRNAGFAAAVDDFGMGYSSLNLIREIPWDVLKLDKNFLPADKNDKKSITSLMYKHVATMAHDIGLETVTEGVETKDQLDILRDNQCKIAQGFYFDKPLPVEEFEERMKKGYQI